MITVDEAATKRKREELDDYLRRSVLSNDEFLCAFAPDCRSSCSKGNRVLYEGQLSHIGDAYCLELNGKPLRLMIVGQEYGQSVQHVGTIARTEMIMRSRDASFSGRNPHMRGTTSKLRLLLNGDVGKDNFGETIGYHHLFECMSLVNFLLCTALREARNAKQDASGGGKGAATSAMRRNCATHFRRCVGILEPTLIIVQGQGVRKWVEKGCQIDIDPGRIIKTTIDNHFCDIVAFDHPSAGGASGYWGNSIKSRYLTDVVKPTLLRYRTDVFSL